ncbi:arsenic transporter [Rhizobium halophytocola]|uniref:Arsenical pump membrane protein n=1 Tax=Rhizobium halophytocola TaxID=735519 RepID=A0ABS4E4M6_9HYPH|nr:arsenic transporter [Rhizobium halophytocola]MBP1852859.1 arsenical pump membrane protein [Rhizobium halophytocola]
MSTITVTWAISALAVLGVVTRPCGWPEAIWAVVGAILLIAIGAIGFADALAGVAKGFDVYLFLLGMMMLSELARQEGLFDWLASIATHHAGGSPRRLFSLIYMTGVATTVFLSNDATAVVLTPAVYAACRAAQVKDPLPYLLICVFIANAASFALPISNPANLVIFGDRHMPTLVPWLKAFTLPSLAAVGVTFLTLLWTQRSALAADQVVVTQPTSLPASARLTGSALIITAIIMLGSSALGFDLGIPTFAAAVISTSIILFLQRKPPFALLKNISWSVLPLVAGLFVLVQALEATGLINVLSSQLKELTSWSTTLGPTMAGASIALASNLVNNLPAGLIAGGAVHTAQASEKMARAILIGVDLGPNLSVTGSLATILWLNALRREGLDMTALAFLKLGVIVMTPALLVALSVM